MLSKKLALLWQVFATLLVLCASNTVMAGEVGTTPDGNVIYEFLCPTPNLKDANITIDLPNHIGEHPEWDIESGYGSYTMGISNPNTGAEFSDKSRSGQILKCFYDIKILGYPIGSRFYYRYKVKREIISCDSTSSRNWRCILKDGGEGGKSPSSATSSSPTPSINSDTKSDSLGVAQGCCTILQNPTLKGRLGRVVVAFPDGAVPKNTRVDMLKDGKVVQGGFGNQSWELLPGVYEVSISSRRVGNLTVKAGHDTTVKVGVMRISAGKETRVDVLDAGKTLTGGYGNQLIGLPLGSYDIQVAGQTEHVTISEGKVTDF